MIKVLKFGGTSVGSAANMHKVASIIENEGSRVTVLSAMSGTTDSLVKISALAKGGNHAEIPSVMATLTDKYSKCITELLTAGKDEALAKMNSVFALIESQAANYVDGRSDKAILAQGELLTSFIFAMFMNEQGKKAVLLNAPGFMFTDGDGKPDKVRLREKLAPQVKDDNVFYITQGFICTNAEGGLDNLGRGGSDYSAALMGEAIDAGEVQIWTDIDGMHNNDPRFVDKTYPIRRMSFDEAAELAYFGAKILHPATIQPCKDKGIPVRLKNTMEPAAPGTLITNDDSDADFCAVAAKDNITVVRIHSTRMLLAYGFLRKVFEVFEVNKTSIDMITTSEVDVALTVDNDNNLEKIERELREYGNIHVDKNNTIICVAGRFGQERSGVAAKVFTSLAEVPVKMISYGASSHSLVMLIDMKDKVKALKALNKGLFNI